MIRLVVPPGQELEVRVGDATLHLRQVDGVIRVDAIHHATKHALVLDPVLDREEKPGPNDVSLGRNLTMLRIPEMMRRADAIRLVVWNRDQGDGIMVHDIIEGTPAQIINTFNANRRGWIGRGCRDLARLEVVPAVGWTMRG